MTAAFVKRHTVGASTNSPWINLVLDSAVPAGNLIVFWLSFANTTGPQYAYSINKMAGETNSWSNINYVGSAITTADWGAAGYLYAIKTTVDWSAGTYSIQLYANSLSTVLMPMEFSGVSIAKRGTAGTGTNTRGNPSASTSGTALVAGDLVIGGANIHQDGTFALGTGIDTDTKNGSWSTGWSAISSGSDDDTAASMQYKIITATGVQTYNPPMAPDGFSRNAGATVTALIPDISDTPISTVDSGTTSITESSTISRPTTFSTDSGTKSITEISSIVIAGIAFSSTDAGTRSVTESSSLLINTAVASSDTGTTSITETSSKIVYIAVLKVDTGTQSVTESSSIVITQSISSTDDSILSVTEAIDIIITATIIPIRMGSLYRALLKSMPRSAFKLIGTGDPYLPTYTDEYGGSLYIDITGNGNSLTGTLSFVSPILSGNDRALSVNASETIQVTSTLFMKGQESQQFSLTGWVLPLTFTGTTSILSHTGVYDGLAFDGDAIRFRINFSTLGIAEVKWPVPDFTEVYNVVATYSPQKIQLYINGELVKELELTEEQIADGFATEPSSSLYSGESASGTERLLIDGIATFSRVLSSNEVRAHFSAGRDIPTTSDIVNYNYGASWDGTNRDVVMERVWNGLSDWQSGIGSNISSASGILMPINDPTTDLSIAGTWTGIMGLGSIPSTTIYGVKALWNGDGAYTVSYSFDGTTYTPLVNGQLIPTTNGIDPTGETVDIKVSFTGGIASDPAQVRDITLTAYGSNKVYGSEVSRDLLLTGDVSTALEPNEPIERNTAAGMSFYGGHGTLATDITDTPANIAAVELWVKPDAIPATWSYIFDARPTSTEYMTIDPSNKYSWAGASAVYINGTSEATDTVVSRPGEWLHVIFIPTVPFNSDVIIGNDNTDIGPWYGQVGLVAIYPNALTSTQAIELYNSYAATPTGESIDYSRITIDEKADAYDAYVLDWSAPGTG